MIMKKSPFWLALLLGSFLICCQPETNDPPQEQPPSYPYVIDEEFAENMAQASFDSVSWVTVDPETGNLYVLQRSIPAVTVWTPEGKFVQQWKTEALGYPHSITLHEGSVWITDFAPPRTAGDGWGHCIKHFSMEGELLGTIGTCGEHSQGTGLDPIQFDKVTDVAFDANGNLFVSDGDLGGLNNRVLKMNPSGEVLMEWSAPDNQAGSGPKEFNLPHAVIVDELDRVWIADKLNNRIQVITAEGEYLGEWTFDKTMGPNGLDIGTTRMVEGKPFANVLITFSPIDLSSGLEGQAWVIPALMDPQYPAVFGERTPLAEWKVKDQDGSAMLHSSAISPFDGALYLAFLNRNSPPDKYRNTASVSKKN